MVNFHSNGECFASISENQFVKVKVFLIYGYFYHYLNLITEHDALSCNLRFHA